MQYVKIPRERVGVLIGKGSRVKNEVERRTNTKLDIGEDMVSIEGNAMDEWIAKDIVKAIGRGFNPKTALMLTHKNMTFEMISLSDFGGSEKALNRIRGRVIGRGGTTKKFIEELMGCWITVYGKTVGIIGPLDECYSAKEAIVMLASGASHGNVYRFLEREKQGILEQKFG